MSNWTHVAGIVRLDYLRLDRLDPDFDTMFGRSVQSSDDWYEYDAKPESFLPTGSEGSLTKQVWINPDKSSIAAYTVTIFGDLRDHDDPQDIIDWFKKKCRESKKFGCLIRNATILVENERYGSCSWQDCMDPSFYEDEG